MIIRAIVSFQSQHMKSPSVSCLDVDTSPPTNDSTPAALTPSTPTKSHRRSASCGNNPLNNIQGSGPDMRIIRIRMDLQDGNLYRSILVLIQAHLNPIHSSSSSREIVGESCVPNYLQHAALIAFLLICKDRLMIVIRIRSSGYNGPGISLVQIKLSKCHCYFLLCPQVTSNDKTPTVISSALEKHNQDPKQASRYELIQLLPEGKGKDVKN